MAEFNRSPNQLLSVLIAVLLISSPIEARSSSTPANELFVNAVTLHRQAANLPPQERDAKLREVRALFDQILAEHPDSDLAELIRSSPAPAGVVLADLPQSEPQIMPADSGAVTPLTVLENPTEHANSTAMTGPDTAANGPNDDAFADQLLANIKGELDKLSPGTPPSELFQSGIVISEYLLLAADAYKTVKYSDVILQVFDLPKWKTVLAPNTIAQIKEASLLKSQGAMSIGASVAALVIDALLEAYVDDWLRDTVPPDMAEFAVAFMHESVEGVAAAAPLIATNIATGAGLSATYSTAAAPLYPLAKTAEVLVKLDRHERADRAMIEQTRAYARMQLIALETVPSVTFETLLDYDRTQDRIASDLMGSTGFNVHEGRQMSLINEIMMLRARQLTGRPTDASLALIAELVENYDSNSRNLLKRLADVAYDGAKYYADYTEEVAAALGVEGAVLQRGTDIHASDPGSVANASWIVQDAPSRSLKPGQSYGAFAVGDDGSVTLVGEPLFPAALDPDAMRLDLYDAPDGTHSLAIQRDWDWGGLRARLIDMPDAVPGPALVPEDAVRGQGRAASVLLIGPRVAWSPGGARVLAELRTGEWQAEAIVIDRASGSSRRVEAEVTDPMQWAFADLSTLAERSEPTPDLDFEILQCATEACETPEVVGRQRVPMVVSEWTADQGSVAVSSTSQSVPASQQVWDGRIVVSRETGIFNRTYGDLVSPMDELRAAGVSEQAIAFSNAFAKDSGNGKPGERVAVEFTELGAVDLVRVEPAYARSTSSPVHTFALVTRNGSIRKLALPSGMNRALERHATDQTSRRVLAGEPDPWIVDHYVTGHRRLPSGAQRFVLQGPVSGSCRVCEWIGHAIVYIDVDEGGSVLRQKLVGIIADSALPYKDITPADLVTRSNLLQYVLNKAGYDAGPMDGVTGPRTRRAIEAFQGDHCLTVSGTLTGPVARALVQLDPLSPPDCAAGRSGVDAAETTSVETGQTDDGFLPTSGNQPGTRAGTFDPQQAAAPGSKTASFGPPVGDGPMRTLTSSRGAAAGCSLRAALRDMDNFTWTGGCEDGVAAGAGRLEFFRAGMLQEMLQVGPDREMGLEDGVLRWRRSFPSELRLTKQASAFGGMRWANATFVVPDTFNVHSKNTLHWLVREAARHVQRRGFQCSVGARIGGGCYNLVITSDPEGVAEMRRTNGSIENYPANYVRASLTPELKLSVVGRSPSISYGAAQKQFVQEVIARNKQISEARWSDRMEAILADDERPIDNLADLLRFDKKDTLAALAGGRQIAISPDEVAFRDGAAIVIDRQEPTDIYADVVPQGLVTKDGGWGAFLDAARQAGAVGETSGVIVSCSMNIDEIPESDVVAERTFEAVLESYSRGSLTLACSEAL